MRRASTGLSAVILNRGGRYPRYSLFEDLGKAGFDYVLSMESSFTRYDLEALSGSFPFVRFILLKEQLSPGEEINLAAAELSSPLFFVLWNDLRILRGGGAERMAERLLSGTLRQGPAGQGSKICGLPSGAAGIPDAGNQDNIQRYKRLCTVPLIQDGRADSLPTLTAPAFFPEKKPGSSIKTIPYIPSRERLPSLYPFDGIGIYDRERFIRLGGFDSSIKNFYWQLMDFGFRSSLWGEEISSTQLIKLSYDGAVPQENSTADESYFRFFLKNLAPVFRGDYAHLPFRRFPGYLKRRKDLFAAWKEFFAARAWVKTNSFRFCSDVRTIAERFASFEASESFDAPDNEAENPDANKEKM